METDTKKKCILIVEDEAPMLKTLSFTFEHAGFNVLQARDGESALGVAQSRKPDLILLDIVLPVMDGLSLLKKLRSDGEYGQHVPVILLTNLSADSDAINKAVTEDNPAYYLVKTDWTAEEVVEKVNERLGIS
jgi:DNA-binding response OmpR family regulator